MRAQDKWNAAHRVQYQRNARARGGEAYREREHGNMLKSLYGVTLERYREMLVAQGGCCKICRKEGRGKRVRLCVDHDHRCCPGKKSCGKCIRGLLCNECNIGIAKFGDSGAETEETIQSALEYVSRRPFVHGASEGLMY